MVTPVLALAVAPEAEFLQRAGWRLQMLVRCSLRSTPVPLPCTMQTSRRPPRVMQPSKYLSTSPAAPPPASCRARRTSVSSRTGARRHAHGRAGPALFLLGRVGLAGAAQRGDAGCFSFSSAGLHRARRRGRPGRRQHREPWRSDPATRIITCLAGRQILGRRARLSGAFWRLDHGFGRCRPCILVQAVPRFRIPLALTAFGASSARAMMRLGLAPGRAVEHAAAPPPCAWRQDRVSRLCGQLFALALLRPRSRRRTGSPLVRLLGQLDAPSRQSGGGISAVGDDVLKTDLLAAEPLLRRGR